ncbi:hypothetical protein SAMD00019534_015290, partial [Acytostelium subglobosum LB1]|uniref:hypothetical protein n=1 Tax=Acytostelium subglobosum LB1 TaxID=1410327 RepID=UPI000644EF4E
TASAVRLTHNQRPPQTASVPPASVTHASAQSKCLLPPPLTIQLNGAVGITL